MSTQMPETSPSRLDPALVREFVRKFFDKKAVYMDLAKRFEAPLYVVDPAVLRQRAQRFCRAFSTALPRTRFYYAMKSNNLPYISAILLDNGFGLDVSGGPELTMALELGARDIIFSGPGKSNQELALALDHADRTTLLLDSPGELARLKTLAADRQKEIRVGIRLNSNPDGLWQKFGVLPETLEALYQEIRTDPFLRFRGLQFHSSWNLNPNRQAKFILELGKVLAGLPAAFRNACEFIDIGGGYWPEAGEWSVSDQALVHYHDPATPIEEFARTLSKAVKKALLPHVDAAICFEPGRWLCSDAVHILVQVLDKKAPDLVITDAGTNALGWERLESDYFPVLNLSQSELTERPCRILGSLCTPHDVWGYAYFGREIQEGDILMIPCQGAYTYSLRQSFIKPLPKVVTMADGGQWIETPFGLNLRRKP